MSTRNKETESCTGCTTNVPTVQEYVLAYVSAYGKIGPHVSPMATQVILDVLGQLVLVQELSSLSSEIQSAVDHRLDPYLKAIYDLSQSVSMRACPKRAIHQVVSSSL